jgi:hypothetical protein
VRQPHQIHINARRIQQYQRKTTQQKTSHRTPIDAGMQNRG